MAAVAAGLAGLAAGLRSFVAAVTRARIAFASARAGIVNAIGVDGKYIENTTLEHVHANVPGTGLDSRTLPNQIALVVSLLTGFSRGPAHRGRVYLPMPTMVVGGDGRIDPGEVSVVKTAFNTLLTDLNAIDAGFKVAVMSRKAGAAIGRNVTGVEIGRVLDTQRRRRNKLAEAY